MQLMPDTAQQYGVRNPNDPVQSIEGAARFLRHLMVKYKGDTTKVLAAYNAGEGAVDQYNGVPPYAETQEYVRQGRRLLAPTR
jgi:soluble lytic murein transglycosylase-like protein